MGCANCQKNRERREAAAGKTIYLECPACGTLLHGRKKDMPKISGTPVCGECYKRWMKMEKLKKTK